MNATNNHEVVAEFPPAAQKWLELFYAEQGVAGKSPRDKINALRAGNVILQNSVFTADGDIQDDDEELRVLEFYILTKSKFIK